MSKRAPEKPWLPSRATKLAVVLLLSSGAGVPSGAGAQAIEEVCDGLARAVSDVPSLVVSATDTLVHDHRLGRTALGCQLQMGGRVSAFRDTTSPDALLRQALVDQGWQEDLRYGADGPDGTAFAFAKGSVLCMIRASWDGGDITDPSYVPEDRYELVVGCIETSP